MLKRLLKTLIELNIALRLEILYNVVLKFIMRVHHSLEESEPKQLLRLMFIV